MIRDMMDVHNAFLGALEGAIVVDGSEVPVRFFNAQPKQKLKPIYPEVVVQVFAPAPDSSVIVGSTQKVVGVNVEIQPPPKRFSFGYQVDLHADRFDHAAELYGQAFTLFPGDIDQKYLAIDGDSYEVRLMGVQGSSDTDDGTFQYALTFEVDVPVYLMDPVVAKRIVTSVDEGFNVNIQEL